MGRKTNIIAVILITAIIAAGLTFVFVNSFKDSQEFQGKLGLKNPPQVVKEDIRSKLKFSFSPESEGLGNQFDPLFMYNEADCLNKSAENHGNGFGACFCVVGSTDTEGNTCTCEDTSKKCWTPT